MLLDLIRKNAVYGALQLEPKKGEWVVSCCIRHPAGTIATVTYSYGKKLEVALSDLLPKSQEAYKMIVQELLKAKQMELQEQEEGM